MCCVVCSTLSLYLTWFYITLLATVTKRTGNLTLDRYARTGSPKTAMVNSKAKIFFFFSDKNTLAGNQSRAFQHNVKPLPPITVKVYRSISSPEVGPTKVSRGVGLNYTSSSIIESYR